MTIATTMKRILLSLGLTVALLCAPGCQRRQSTPRPEPLGDGRADIRAEAASTDDPVDPCALVLLPQAGSAAVDREIAHLQQQARESAEPAPMLDRLGWAFVAKAREGEMVPEQDAIGFPTAAYKVTRRHGPRHRTQHQHKPISPTKNRP